MVPGRGAGEPLPPRGRGLGGYVWWGGGLCMLLVHLPEMTTWSKTAVPFCTTARGADTAVTAWSLAFWATWHDHVLAVVHSWP